MANMSIGGYTLKHNPSEMDPIESEKAAATVPTYEGGAYFDFGMFLIGTDKNFSWSYMEADEYATLRTKYVARLPVVFDPQDGSNKTYNVEIKWFKGNLFRKFGSAAGTFRKDVKMTLFLISEVIA
jgi:hypothetical protein